MGKIQMTIIHKVHADSKRDGMSFVLSDETPDRLGDVIMSDGWDLTAFNKNPVALFAHRADFLLGTWDNLRIEKKQLIGDLKPAPKGTSERIDEVTRLIEAGILKATSVGFRPLERQPRKINDKFVGEIFTKQDLVETSLVAIPANPNALAIAKSLNISDDVRSLVFAVSGTKSEPVQRDDHIDAFVKLTEPDRWSPEEARRAKLWVADWMKIYPYNSMYRKMHRLMDEIETVRTIVAEVGKKRLS
jgi:HK97 family phage prohead protease